MSGEVERRLASHGILLPTPNTPAANHVPLDDAGQRIVGRLGVDVRSMATWTGLRGF